MAKKKTEEKEIRHAGDPNVMGLRGAVVEQPITDTLDENYMPYAMSRDRLPRHSGDRRLQALPPEAAVHHV